MRLKFLSIAAAAATLTLVSLTAVAAKSTASSVTQQPVFANRVLYRTVDVDGISIFYREAGDPKNPTLLLLHGFPSSSRMFRDLMPLLANRFHVVAPDYPGAGYSDAPGPETFTPTFENLANVMESFVERIGLQKFTIYMQDFGGPVGFRIAVEHPDWVQGLIVQNANAFIEGIAPDQLQGMKSFSGERTPENVASVDRIVSRDFTLFMYKTGSRDFAAMEPDAWNVDSWLLDNPSIKLIQTELIHDYYSNILEYPKWQEYLRQYQPKTLIVWGKNDPIFLPPGAEAYQRVLPNAELHFYDTGHFALEEDVYDIANKISRFFGNSPK